MLQRLPNGLSLGDFAARPTVLISDESHHLSAATKRGGLSQDERERTWEHTVDTALAAHRDSLLLQFTATADVSTPELLAQKEARTIVDYPLSSFREDGSAGRPPSSRLPGGSKYGIMKPIHRKKR